MDLKLLHMYYSYSFVTAGELNKVGDRVLVAQGGDGGNSMNNFRAQKGHALSINLDLKLISDIGLVGLVFHTVRYSSIVQIT
jgi:GTPase involved in cell partitioning and DNA repair